MHQYEPIAVKFLGVTEYRQVWQDMKDFTDARDRVTTDELWITEHEAVFTQGHNGKPEHLLDSGDIPIVQTDRGGQITYHGPGQLVLYCLFDLNRMGLGVRSLVTHIESSVIEFLARYRIEAFSRKDAPGVYVNQAKIAALGLRIRKGCCYHGLSLNIDMDLGPFSGINPCGLEGQAVTRTADFNIALNVEQAGREIADILIRNTSPHTA